jgi:phosphonate transport system permease protein
MTRSAENGTITAGTAVRPRGTAGVARSDLERTLDAVMNSGEKRRQLAFHLLLYAIAAAVLAWSAIKTNIRPDKFIEGIPAIANFLGRMFPPSAAYVDVILWPTLETIYIAIWGTLLGIVVALPLGLLAARNISPHWTMYAAARFVLNTLRGVNELVFALIFVSAVGLGPFPGVLALALHNAGMLGKFYAEAIEAVDPGPVEAIEATGARKLLVILYAILPQVRPHFITYNLYRLEVSVRSATVLGLVGAGGIGFYLLTSMRLFDYQNTATALIAIVILVILTDYLGAFLRKRVI